MRFLPALLLLATLSACPKAKCNSITCTSGCCDASGTCQTGDSASACGSGGALCISCAGSQCGAVRVCSTAGSGGGTGGGTGGGGGAAGSRTVTLTNTTTFIDERGTQSVSNLGDAGITLFLPDGGAVPGARTSSAFVAQNVPAGEYTFRWGNSYYVARGDTLDLGFTNLGRPDQQRVDAGAATFTLATAGLPAWSDLDWVLLFSHGGDLYGFNTGALTSGPADGEVPTSFTWDYGALSGRSSAQRIDAAQGDTLWAIHMKNQAVITTPVPGAAEDGGVLDVPFDCQVATSAAHLTSVTINAGPNAAGATFVAPQTRSVALTLPRTQWATRTGEVHPQAVLAGETFYVAAEPTGAATNSADLISCFNDPRFGNPVSDINRSVTVINTLPASWNVLGVGVMNYRVTTQVLDAGTWSSAGSIWAESPLNQPFLPQVHPPTQLTVQSIAAHQLLTAAVAGPLSVTWNANPAAPAATQFSVAVLRITRPAGFTIRTQVASALTRGASFTFPVGTLTAGGIYQLRVRAVVTTSAESGPFLGRTSSFADAISNPFLAQ